MFLHLSRFRLENLRCSSVWCVLLRVQMVYSNTSRNNNKQKALNPLSETRFEVGQGRDRSSGLTFAAQLFRGSTGWSRGGGRQRFILGQGLRPLLALGSFNSLEFSGMFVAFVMCFGLVLGRGELGVTIHLLSLPAPSMSWHVGGRSEGGRALATQGANPCHCHCHHSTCVGPRVTECILICELPGKPPLPSNPASVPF